MTTQNLKTIENIETIDTMVLKNLIFGTLKIINEVCGLVKTKVFLKTPEVFLW